MAAKRASEFVPLHTPSGLVENCTFNISLNDTFEEVRIQCDATVSSGSMHPTTTLSPPSPNTHAHRC